MTTFLFWVLALFVLYIAWSTGDLCPKFTLWVHGLLRLGRCAPHPLETAPLSLRARLGRPRR